jgi:hypothetical protein
LWHSQAFGENFGKITCDLGLAVSNDGVRFRDPSATPGRIFIHHDESPTTPVPGHDEFNTILCQGNGILNVGNETRIYHDRWRNVGQKAGDIAEYYRAEVALATLPRDRWGSLDLNPGADDGMICSAPLLIPAKDVALAVNADGAEGLTIELLDTQFRPIAGFAGGRVSGPGGLDCPVRWEGHALSELIGKTVRVQVRLQCKGDIQPRVYALYLG